MKVDYLRISVTDRCNLKCIYCEPLGANDLLTHDDVLRFEEIQKIVRLATQLGVTKFRITGGEPLIKRNIIELIHQIAQTKGVQDLSLTTNGLMLPKMAAELKQAGLKRVNISLDCVDKDVFHKITGNDALEETMAGIEKAIAVGLNPVKINSVILKNINESQILKLAQMCVDMPADVRFIEYCPTSKRMKSNLDCIPNSQIRKIIESNFGPLTPSICKNSNGPASNFTFNGAQGKIGFISGRTKFFCEQCSRLRLTSDGRIKSCLYSSNYFDIKKMLRNQSSDEQILNSLQNLITQKHKHNKRTITMEDFSMRCIGG